MSFSDHVDIRFEFPPIIPIPDVVRVDMLAVPALLDMTKARAACAKREALLALWKSVASNLEFRHPDPRVTVVLDVSLRERAVAIRFNMPGLRDTDDRNRERQSLSNFHMLLLAAAWPGREAAEAALLGAWLSYLRHECMELVYRRDRQGLVSDGWGPAREPWHPHTGTSLTNDVQYHIDLCFRRYCNRQELAEVASVAIGAREAERLFASSELLALKQLQTELEYASGQIAVDQ